ncbi:MAG: SAM-dependent methyltransferase [Firmicutes bacterium]|nr:SAM-dependent methyltransferase [Bacillota bacterium]
MTKLTPRLNLIANEILPGETMADIGTDHGFLPLYLWEQGICPKVIMADISKGSLQKARDNCYTAYPDGNFDLRLGSGIEVLEKGEVDVIAIAGMGGILMTEILGADIEKTKSYKRLVLQPRNNVGVLRHWLYNNGFSLTNEQLVREGKYICEIITAIPKEVAVLRDLGPDAIEYEYPHKLVDFKGPLTAEYLDIKLQIERNILTSMNKAKEPDFKAVRSQEYRIDYLERLVKSL